MSITKNIFQDGVYLDIDNYNVKNTMLIHGRNLSFISGENNNFILFNTKGTEPLDVFLSDGFYPIGIEQYLGIAYIFSYNPTTGQGEVGTYPSPEYITSSGMITKQYRPLKNFIKTGDTLPSNFRSTLFNFDFKHPLSLEARIEYDGSVNIYITDYKNLVRVVNSGFVRENEFHYSLGKKSLYTEAALDDEIGLLPRSSKILEIDLVGVENNGQLFPGNYIYYFYYQTQGGNQTELVGQSFTVSVYDGNGTASQITGGKIDVGNNILKTNKSVHIALKNVDTTFGFLKVFYERITGNEEQDREVFEILKSVNITSSQVDFIHTGTENERISSVEELNTIFADFGIARTLAQVDNKLYIANTNASESIDSDIFELFSSKIKLEWFQTSMQIPGTNNLDDLYSQKINQSNGGYYEPLNIYYNLGYWGGEAYTYGIKYILNNGETLIYPLSGFDYFNGDAVPEDTNNLLDKVTGIMRFPVRNSLVVNEFLEDQRTTVLGVKMNMKTAFDDVVLWGKIKAASIGCYFFRSRRNKQCITQGYIARAYRFLGQNEEFGGNGWSNFAKDVAIEKRGYHAAGNNDLQMLIDASARHWKTWNFPLFFPSLEFTYGLETVDGRCGTIAKKNFKDDGSGKERYDFGAGTDTWNYVPQYTTDPGDNPHQCTRSFRVVLQYDQYGIPVADENLVGGDKNRQLIDPAKKRRYILEVDNLNYAFFSNDWNMDRQYLLNVLNDKAIYINPIAHVAATGLSKDSSNQTTISVTPLLDIGSVLIGFSIPDGLGGAVINLTLDKFGGATTETGVGIYYVLAGGSGTSPDLAGYRFYTDGTVTNGDQNNPATVFLYPKDTRGINTNPYKLLLTNKIYKSDGVTARWQLNSGDPECRYLANSFGIFDQSITPHPATLFTSRIDMQQFNYGRRHFEDGYNTDQFQDFYVLATEMVADSYISFNLGDPDLTDMESQTLIDRSNTTDGSGNRLLSNDRLILTYKNNLPDQTIEENNTSNRNRNMIYSDLNKMTALVNIYEKERYIPFIGKAPNQVTNKAKLLNLYSFASEPFWIPISKRMYWENSDELYPEGSNTILAKADTDSTTYTFTETSIIDGVSKKVSLGLFNGDCFLNVGFVRNHYGVHVHSTDNGYKYVDQGKMISIVSENNHNPAFRKDFIANLNEENYQISESNLVMGEQKANRTYFPYYAGILNKPSEWWYYIDRYKLLESEAYLKGYSTLHSGKRFVPFDPSTPFVRGYFYTRVWFSQRQSFSDTVDFYREVLPLDFMDYDIKYGQIVALIESNNLLYMIQERAIHILNYNDRIQVAGDGTGPIFASSEGRLSQYPLRVISTEFGSQHQWSVVKTKTGIAGIDARMKTMWMVSGDQMENVSQFKIQSKLRSETDVFRFNDVEISKTDIRGGYNQLTGDVYFVFYDQSVPDSQNYFTIGYNEYLKVFTDEYDFKPPMFFNLNDDLFSFPPLRDDAGNLIGPVPFYKHNSNNVDRLNFYGEDYPMEFEFVVNENLDYQKVIDNLQLITNNVYPDKIYYNIESAEFVQEILMDINDIVFTNAEFREDKLLVVCENIAEIINGVPTNTESLVDVDSRIRSKYIRVKVVYQHNPDKPMNTDSRKEIRVQSINSVYRVSFS